MKILISTGIYLIFWLLITQKFTLEYILVGIFASLLTSYLYYQDILFSKKFLEPKRYIYACYYLLFLLKECALSCLRVGYFIIQPKISVKPGILRLKTTLKSNLAKVILANSITLTPGTLTVHIEDEYLYIHVLNLAHNDKIQHREQVLGKFENILKKVFE